MIGRTISHYRIVEKLGEGGMGVVYKAEDTKLKRAVALKFLPPELTRDKEAKARFIHEAQAASALQHHNICTIHEIDETPEGGLFIVMDRYQGETLKEKIAKGPLPIEEAVDIASQVAAGLSKAHEAGMVHRDVKPANIIVTEDGVVKIVDFGVAKLAGQTKLTKTGTTMGTVSYISPEQGRGAEVDHRSDIWSFGVVLYEMLTGRLPFTGDFEPAIVYSIINEEPEPITALRTGVPIALERVVDKCLSKDPSERYQSATDLGADLRRISREMTGPSSATKPATPSRPRVKDRRVRITTGVSAVAIVALALLFLYTAGPLKDRIARRNAPSGGRIEALAILPFTNAGGDPDTEYLGDEIPADIINSLSRLPNFRVVPRSTSYRYRGQDANLRAVGRELGVGAVLTGQISVRGNTMSIRVDLVDVVGDSQLWGNRYTRQLADILSVEQQIANEISNALELRLSSADRASLGAHDTPNPEAYRLYLKGRYFWNKRSEEGLKSAIDYFHKAIELDPTYALAYSGIADAYIVLVSFSFMSPMEAYPKAKAAAMKALEIDSTLAAAHTSLASVLGNYEWDWARSGREFERAIQLDSTYATALHWYSFDLARMGRINQAIAVTQRAAALDPLSLMITANLGYWYFVAREYETAERQCLKVIEMDANFPWAHTVLGLVYARLGMQEKSLDELATGARLSNNSPEYLSYLGYEDAVVGRTEDARKILGEFKRRSQDHYIAPCLIALIHVGLGEKDEAFEWLQKAYEVRDTYLNYQLFEPSYDPIRSDPRFDKLLRSMGLDPSWLERPAGAQSAAFGKTQ
jgi:serine/threonine protein kinase/tetratricopeptide (TPR) repeat protein